MDAIVKLVVDPGWWFTAVFVAVVAGVAASFLRDSIVSSLARASSAFHERKRRRDEQIDRSVEALLADDTVLLLGFVKAQAESIIVFLLLLAGLALSVVLPALFIGDAHLLVKLHAVLMFYAVGGLSVWASWHHEPRRTAANIAFHRRTVDRLKRRAHDVESLESAQQADQADGKQVEST